MAADLYTSACAAGRISAAEMLVILLTGEKNLHKAHAHRGLLTKNQQTPYRALVPAPLSGTEKFSNLESSASTSRSLYSRAMSRSIARVVAGTVRAMVAPLGARQKTRVLARVMEILQRSDLAVVETRRGDLHFRQLRGSFLASAVASFHTDEPETLRWIDAFAPSDTLWDVGANVGLYALYAALDPTIRVMAFEPSGFNFGPLVDHIALNGMGERVTPLCVALGLSSGLSALHMRHTDAGHGSNALGVAANNFRQFEPLFTQGIPAFSIDSFRAFFDLPAPDHLKIDVDGIELDILRGAPDTLPEVRSVMMEVEGDRGLAHAEEMTRLLAAAGLVEQTHVRSEGSRRNRLYTRPA